MIQEAYTYVDLISDMDVKLKLIDTLITVTSGKVYIISALLLPNFLYCIKIVVSHFHG